MGLSTGVEWNELVVFSPSWESLDGLCTQYTGRRGGDDLVGDDGVRLLRGGSKEGKQGPEPPLQFIIIFIR